MLVDKNQLSYSFVVHLLRKLVTVKSAEHREIKPKFEGNVCLEINSFLKESNYEKNLRLGYSTFLYIRGKMC